MNKKALQVLEYKKIIQLLADEASSAPGKQMCRDLLPMNDLEEIRAAQAETADAVSRIIRKGNLSLMDVVPVHGMLQRLAIGGALNTTELLRIAGLLETAGRAKTYGRPAREDEAEDSLTGYFSALEPVYPVSSEIRRCILAEDEISDAASPELRRIRRQMHQTNDKIHSTLTGMLNGSYRNYLQDAVITMRNDRYCIPVKAEYKNQVAGMVHDQSSTGSTVFIEPMAVVKLNNEIKELHSQELDAIQQVLADLSTQAAEYADDIRRDFDLLLKLDFAMAKGKLALKQQATQPLFNEDGYVKIRKGRHPLLDPKKVVPIDLELGKDFTLLIITGPNTGGKTVSLKTMGLFTLMGEAGLHIPAGDRSELALFREVYADIGDEQSIEQSLSTFSSHMTNIVEFLKDVTEDDLVLFDELGAGTDPTEGAALAIAILSSLHDRDIRAMATTHYSELKVYALTTPGVTNASCEFDVATLRPTYRILIGVPGKSNAFAISSKLGLSDDIIADAKNHIDAQDLNFEDLLTDLESGRIAMEKQQDELTSSQREIERLKNELKAERDKLNHQKEAILQKANKEASEILKEAKDYADETMRKFNKFGKNNISAADMERERENLRKKLAKTQSKQSDIRKDENIGQNNKPTDFHPGDLVKVLSMNVRGTVSTTADAKGYLYVQMGIIRSKVHYKDLILLPDADITGPGYQSTSGKHGGNRKGSGSSNIKVSKSMSVKSEINLLGKTVDEAISMLDKYLDDAYLAHLTEVRIVHGKGTGALRNGVHQYLRRAKHVKEFHLAAFGEGDAGVTIAVFK